jgi:hypothetical protein
MASRISSSFLFFSSSLFRFSWINLCSSNSA